MLLALPRIGIPAQAASIFAEPLQGTSTSTNRLAVVICGFDNRTGTPALGFWRNGVNILVWESLEEIKAVRLLTSVSDAFRMVAQERGARQCWAFCRKAGELLHAQYIIYGGYQRWGSKWQLRARVFNVATGRASKELRATSTDWFQLCDEIVEQILSELQIVPTDAERQLMTKRCTSSAKVLEWICRSQTSRSEAETEGMLLKAIQTDPQCAEAHFGLSLHQLKVGKMEAAEASVRRSLQLRQDDWMAQLQLGAILTSQKRFIEAERALKAAARLKPDSAEVFKCLGYIYVQTGQPLEALENYREAVHLDPFNASNHAMLASCFAQRGRIPDAQRELNEASRLVSPSDVSTLEAIGYGYEVLRDQPLAIKQLSEALRSARNQHFDSNYVHRLESRIRDLKTKSIPSYVSAVEPESYSKSSLNAFLRERLNEADLILVTNPLVSSPEMELWARKLTKGGKEDLQKGRMLFEGLCHRPNPGWGGMRTAQQTFAEWLNPEASFRCLEYANLYVSLARSIGLKAYFTLVYEDCDGRKVWHACACLFAGDRTLLVDPAYSFFGIPHRDFVVLDDVGALAVWLDGQNIPNRERIAVQLAPRLARAQYGYALSLIHKGEVEEAAKALQVLQELDPSESLLLEARGELVLRQGKLEQALELLEKARGTKYTHTTSIEWLLGYVYLLNNQPAKAREAYQNALRQPNSVDNENFLRGRIAAISDKIGDTDAINRSERKIGADYDIRGRVFLSRNELDLALENFNEAIRLDENNGKFYVHRAAIYVSKGNPDKAVQDYSQAIRLLPNDSLNYLERGRIYSKQGELEKAMQDFKEVIRLNPVSSITSNTIDELLGECGEFVTTEAEPDEAGERLAECRKWQLFATLVMALKETRAFHLGLEFADPACVARVEEWLAEEGRRSLMLTVPGERSVAKFLTDNLAVNTKNPSAQNSNTKIDVSEIQNLAESGDASAQVQLANFLYAGSHGLTVNNVEAFKWAAVSAAQGSREGASLVREFELFMNSEELSNAKAAARSFIEGAAVKKKHTE